MTTETIAQRQRRLAAEYANENASLHDCNAAARKDAEKLRTSTSDLAVAAMEAVARSMGGSTVAAADVLKSVKGAK